MEKKKAPSKRKPEPKRKPGPKPEKLKIDGDWKDAVKSALKRGKPALARKEK